MSKLKTKFINAVKNSKVKEMNWARKQIEKEEIKKEIKKGRRKGK